MKNYLSILIVLLISGCGNGPQPSVIIASTKLTEQTDSIVGAIYERNTIKGDFNGDGKIECAYIEYAKDFDHNGTLIFSDSSIPKMVSQYYMIWDMINVGDVNMTRRMKSVYIYMTQRMITLLVLFTPYIMDVGLMSSLMENKVMLFTSE